MRASWVREDTFLRLTLLPDAEDPITSPRTPHLRMLTNVATLKLPHEIELPHPDLLALAAYSIAFPWTKRRLRLSTPVSDRMREAFARSGIDASGPVGSHVDPREAGKRLSLAYSGGADSIATSEVLPDDTAYVHLRRVKHPRVVNRMTHVRLDVIEALVRKAQTRGRDVSVRRLILSTCASPSLPTRCGGRSTISSTTSPHSSPALAGTWKPTDFPLSQHQPESCPSGWVRHSLDRLVRSASPGRIVSWPCQHRSWQHP